MILIICMHRRFRGVSPACPIPRNREIDFVSSSFSLRAVRASEAKLHGRMKTVILIAGPPGSQDRRVVSGALFAHLLCTGAWVLMIFGTFCKRLCLFVLLCAWVLTSE